MTEKELQENGYYGLKEIADGEYAGLLGFLFTTAIIKGFNEIGYTHRWCYHSAAEAIAELELWDGTGHPGGEWTRYLGPDGVIKRDEYV
jgi:hypothetical protein